MEFRVATIGDFDKVMKLMEDVFKDFSPNNLEIYKRSYQKALRSDNVEQFLLIIDDEIVGHVTLTLYHSFYNKGNIMWIDDVAVRRDKRQQGYGSKIMDYSLNYANEHNVVEVFIGADNDNLAAQKLYEKFIPKATSIFFITKLRDHGL